MDLGAAGLTDQPFPTHGKPLVFVPYSSTDAALEALNQIRELPAGLALLQGPPLSGKTTIISTFLRSLPERCCTAVIDGQGLNTNRLLNAILTRFGFDLEPSSTNELLGLVRVFALQQTASHEAPILIIENAHELRPSALHTLCELAELRVRQDSAVKLILVSDQSLAPIVSAPAMSALSKRVINNLHIRPMNQRDVRVYLHTKLSAAGCQEPEDVFPAEVCNDIWQASAGWPGIVDRVALLALAQAETLPVDIADIEHPALPIGTWAEQSITELGLDADNEPPMLIVSSSGKVVSEMSMNSPRAIVGRSAHNDISINSRFISRHHTLFVRNGKTTFLMDLNSTNGTFVNSKRVSNHVLLHEDVVTVGHHHIKFLDPSATNAEELADIDFGDTVVMKTLEDMRALLAEENTTILPIPAELKPNANS